MTLNVQQKAEIVAEYKRGDSDTGSAEVQVALLSARIKTLTEHFRTHIHDHHSRVHYSLYNTAYYTIHNTTLHLKTLYMSQMDIGV